MRFFGNERAVWAMLVVAASAAVVGACEAVSGLQDLSVSQTPSRDMGGRAFDAGDAGEAGGEASSVPDAADAGGEQ
jgi:hypothetical protein